MRGSGRGRRDGERERRRRLSGSHTTTHTLTAHTRCRARRRTCSAAAPQPRSRFSIGTRPRCSPGAACWRCLWPRSQVGNERKLFLHSHSNLLVKVSKFCSGKTPGERRREEPGIRTQCTAVLVGLIDHIEISPWR